MPRETLTFENLSMTLQGASKRVHVSNSFCDISFAKIATLVPPISGQKDGKEIRQNTAVFDEANEKVFASICTYAIVMDDLVMRTKGHNVMPTSTFSAFLGLEMEKLSKFGL